LNFLARRRIDLLGIVLRHDLARQTADPRPHQQLQIIWSDRLVKHRSSNALQPKSDIHGCDQAHAVAGNRVVSLGDGLQPQVIEKQLVPGPNEVKPLVFDLTRIEHGAAAEALP